MKRKVRRCSTFWRSCTTASHCGWPVATLAQSSHWRHCTTNSIVTACWIVVPAITSRCSTSLIFSRLLCGSVHRKLASTTWYLFRPRMRLRHRESSSRDSSSARTQYLGGCRYRSHSGQCTITYSLISPSAMSTCAFTHGAHMFAAFASVTAPHMQHSTCVTGAGAASSISIDLQ